MQDKTINSITLDRVRLTWLRCIWTQSMCHPSANMPSVCELHEVCSCSLGFPGPAHVHVPAVQSARSS